MISRQRFLSAFLATAVGLMWRLPQEKSTGGLSELPESKVKVSKFQQIDLFVSASSTINFNHPYVIQMSKLFKCGNWICVF
jgi:hypothetical protein